MAAERLIALERNGTMRLYRINGDSPHEVAHVDTGSLNDADAITVAVALTDLCQAVTERQRPEVVAHGPRTMPSARPSSLPRARRWGDRGAEVLTYLRSHPGSTSADIAHGLGWDTKRVSNALYYLGKSGRARKDDQYRWTAAHG